MKSREFQFLKNFLLLDSELPDEQVYPLLDVDIEIHQKGEPDTVVVRDNKLLYYHPTSILKFLFNITYHLTSKVIDEHLRDRLTLGLIHLCKDYIYNDYDDGHKIQFPVVVDLDKLHSVSTVLSEVIEPMVGKVQRHQVLFVNCPITDAASIIKSVDQIQLRYNLTSKTLTRDDFPLLMVNANIHNKAAVYADLLFCSLMVNLGEHQATKIIKNIVLGDRNLIGYVATILKTLEGDPVFVMDFLKYLQCHALLTDAEQSKSQEAFYSVIQADKYLNKHIKVGAEKYTPQVWKQWSQWSMLMGLIEKQLGPMRGSMWPTTENMKPHEQNMREMMAERAKEKKKNQLNFEEMLETARDVYDHNAVEPGKLIEVMLKDNRVWKT